MNKKLLASALISSMLAMGGIALAQDGVDTGSGNDTQTGTGSQTKNIPTVCMKAAVEKRETSIMEAWDGYALAVQAALTQRKTDLLAAWDKMPTQTTQATARVALQEPKQALTKAFQNYKNAMKKARTNLRTARSRAWSQFNSDRLVCGVNGAQSAKKFYEIMKVEDAAEK